MERHVLQPTVDLSWPVRFFTLCSIHKVRQIAREYRHGAHTSPLACELLGISYGSTFVSFGLFRFRVIVKRYCYFHSAI